MNKHLERREKAIDKLLGAALEVLEEVGFSKLRVADVIKRSGMSDGSLFRYFAKKDDLVAGALERAFESHCDELESLFPAAAGPPTRAVLLTKLWDIYAHRRLRWTYELSAAASLDATLTPVLAGLITNQNLRVSQKLATLLDAWQPLISPDEYPAFAEMLVAAIQGVVINDLSFTDGFRRGTLLTYLAKIGNAVCENEPVVDFGGILPAIELVPGGPEAVVREESLSGLAGETRAKLVSGTLQLLDEIGFNRLRVADAASRSGMSEGALYRYFPTKHSLIRAALDQTLAEHLARMVAILDPHMFNPMPRSVMFEFLWDALGHPRLRWTYELYAAAAHEPELSNSLADIISAHSHSVEKLALLVHTVCGPIVPVDDFELSALASWWVQGLAINKHDLSFEDRSHMVEFLCTLANRVYGPQRSEL